MLLREEFRFTLSCACDFLVVCNKASEDLGNMAQPKTYYRRHLPHYQPPEAIYHVVFRLAGSLPAEVVEGLRQERLRHEKTIGGIGDERGKLDEYRAHQQAHFERFEQLLDSCATGPPTDQNS